MAENGENDENSLLAFDLKSPCPKCTGRGMDLRYCYSRHVNQVAYETYERALEHLDLTCQWCSHTRYMMTADRRITPVQERVVSA